MTSLLEGLLELEQLDLNLFRSQAHCENFRKTLFGGQVLGQALMASYLTQDELLPHSLHAYFLRAGSSEIPVIYDVEKVRDGRSFISRRAVARQFGRPIFNMATSFHNPEPGYEHQVTFNFPEKHPDDIIAERESRGIPTEAKQQENTITPFHFIPLDKSLFSQSIFDPPEAYFWIKAIDPLPDRQILHHCALAFASDLGLLGTAFLPHEASVFDENQIVASIDHAMWFHAPDFRVDDWLLCRTFSPWAGGARGYAQGHIFDLNGRLIASTAQEGLMRKI